MRPSYWRWHHSVRQKLRAGTPANYRSLCSYYRLVARLVELEEWFETYRHSLTSEVDTYALFDADAYEKIVKAFKTVLLLREKAEAIGLKISQGPSTITSEVRKHAGAASLLVRHEDLFKAISIIDTEWKEGFVDKDKTTQADLPSVLFRCQEIEAALLRFHEWVFLQSTIKKCRELNLERYLDSICSFSASEAAAAFKRRFYLVWISTLVEQSSSLATFIGANRRELINQFHNLDKGVRESALKRICSVASDAARRIANAQSNLGHAGEVGILRRELGKRRRIKPLRRLFAETPNILQALKPCMLMSPLSVSSFLKPGAISFDLVIFDEASQLPTQEAIPSILRAKQVIVAGDSKQLPPTSFFDASIIFESDISDETYGEGIEPLPSLLDDCVAVVPFFVPSTLRWHYRSRDERLIKFSNYYFYNNGLITFPSAAIDAEDQGIRIEYVANGIWDRGKSRTNRAEARRVGSVIIEQLKCYPDRSIGVAAMNVTQREAIEEELEELMSVRLNLAPLLDPSREEPFFIKALENVQGDERDTIIISIGYGKTSDGSLPFGFGPLNQEGGERRLNVLVTRAKRQIILVTSMHSNELAGVNPNNCGAVALRNFIAYAEQGGKLPTITPVITGGETNDFEDAVAEELRGRGFLVDQQVGASEYRIDLAIRDPGHLNRYLLGIECDGATYHSAKTARDRDLLRQQVLRTLGWRLHRVWSIDWFRDRENAIKGILQSIEIAKQAPPEVSVIGPDLNPEGGVKPDMSPEGGKQEDKPPIHEPNRYLPGEPYKKYNATQKEDRNNILNPQKINYLAKKISEIVEYEGPIHKDLLLERLKEIYGIERAGTNVQANVDTAIRAMTRTYGLGKIGEFIKIVGKPIKTFREPGDDVNRLLHEIIKEEIELAILFTVENQFGYQREALPHAVVRLFGFKRVPPGAFEIIGDVVDTLIEKGRLRLSGPNVNLGDYAD